MNRSSRFQNYQNVDFQLLGEVFTNLLLQIRKNINPWPSTDSKTQLAEVFLENENFSLAPYKGINKVEIPEYFDLQKGCWFNLYDKTANAYNA